MSAADLAAIREALPPDRRDAGDCPERAGVCYCKQNAAHAALDRIEQTTLTPEEADAILTSDTRFCDREVLAAAVAKLERIARQKVEQIGFRGRCPRCGSSKTPPSGQPCDHLFHKGR